MFGHVGEVAVQQPDMLALGCQPGSRCVQCRLIPVDADQKRLRRFFKDQCGMAAAAQRAVQIGFAVRRLQKADDLIRQNREMVERRH